MKIIKEFYSKKNKVYLIDDESKGTSVLKVYNDARNKTLEKDLLVYLSTTDIKSPEIYYDGDKYIVMEYVNGINLADTLLKYEQKRKSALELMTCLCINLKRLYNNNYFSKDKLILGDINLRNFIVSKTGIYFIDFEDVKKGDYMDEIAKMLGYFLTNDPPFSTYKRGEYKNIILEYANTFDVSIITLEKKINFVIDRFEEDRRVKYPRDMGL